MSETPKKFWDLTYIDRNAEKCLLCNDVVESKHRHDYVECSCGNVMRDGGKDYIRANMTASGTSENLTEWHEYTLKETEREIAKALSLSRSEFGNYYKNHLELLREYKNYLLYGDIP